VFATCATVGATSAVFIEGVIVMWRDLVYDIGLHNGDDTAYYLHRGYRVVAVDADALLIEQARQRFATEIRQGRLTLLNVAIADHEGSVSFWICESGREWNSLRNEWASRQTEARTVEVACTRLASIIAAHGVPYYLKIDIEGGEENCLRDLAREDLPHYLSVELTDLPTLIHLAGLGYDAFKCVDQASKRPLPFPPRRTSLKQAIKRRAATFPRLRRMLRNANRRLGRVKASIVQVDPRSPSAAIPTTDFNGAVAKDWHFSLASSGPFGDDLPGRWQTLEEAAAVWVGEWARVGYPPPSNRRDLWLDVHATRRAGQTSARADESADRAAGASEPSGRVEGIGALP